MNYCHQREGLREYHCANWVKLCDIGNWNMIDLRSLSVWTNHVKLIDPEITFTTNVEELSLIHYYQVKGRQVSVPKFIIRDNNSGNIYLPQDCFVCS
uniref:Uncharacterized protein n=1 Tax=Panagrolaimus superbus TaxID=310955 RepID=A0A914Y9N1_9BILA